MRWNKVATKRGAPAAPAVKFPYRNHQPIYHDIKVTSNKGPGTTKKSLVDCYLLRARAFGLHHRIIGTSYIDDNYLMVLPPT